MLDQNTSRAVHGYPKMAESSRLCPKGIRFTSALATSSEIETALRRSAYGGNGCRLWPSIRRSLEIRLFIMFGRTDQFHPVGQNDPQRTAGFHA